MCRRSSYRSRACPSPSFPPPFRILVIRRPIAANVQSPFVSLAPPYFHLLQNRCLVLLVLRNHERTQDLLRQQFTRFSMLSSSSCVFAFPPGRGLIFLSLSNSWLTLLRFSPFNVQMRERAASSVAAVCGTSGRVASTGGSSGFAGHTRGGSGVQTDCIDVHIAHFITTKAIKRGSSKSEEI